MFSLIQPLTCRTLTTAIVRSSAVATRRSVHTAGTSRRTVQSYAPWIWGSAFVASGLVIGQTAVKLDSEDIPSDETGM